MTDTRMQVSGWQRHRGQPYPCGLCGEVRNLTKAHVPPQCAGNDTKIQRSRIVSRGNRRVPARSSSGGLYVFGLCETCNGLQGEYDSAYGRLAAALRPHSRTSNGYDPAHRTPMPGALFRPGAVARSMLIGAHALAPALRTRYPEIAANLLSRTPVIALPADLYLLIAVARGTFARIAGSVSGSYFTGTPGRPGWGLGNAIEISNLAEVYFPPLAWVLTDTPQTLTVRGWHDARAWSGYDPGTEHLLSALVPPLPQVSHPHRTPVLWKQYVEMFAGAQAELTELVECTKLPR